MRLTNLSAAMVIASIFLNGCATGEFGLRKLSTQSDAVTDYQDQFSTSLYAGVGIGPSRLNPDTTSAPSYNVNDRVEPAGQLTVGVDITKHFSLEAHTADLGSAGFNQGRINYHVNGASALLYAGGNRDRFKRQGLKPYARVGVGLLENTVVGDLPFMQRNSTHMLVGAGLEYMTPIGVGIRAEGVSFDDDAKYAQLSVMYRTGRKLAKQRPKLAQAKQTIEPTVAAARELNNAPTVSVKPEPCVAVNTELGKVRFDIDSADIKPEFASVLDAVSQTLTHCEDVNVTIAAHADNAGTEQHNQTLSERRAVSVLAYLSQAGVERERLTIQAFGETDPIDSNDTAEGRARNRRAELVVR